MSFSSSGLGFATALDLVESNAYVAILDRSPPPSELSSSRVKYFEVDISKVEQIADAVEGSVAWTKETGAPLGGVINCAGVGSAAKIVDANNEPHSLDLWNFVIAVNLSGTFHLTRLALQHMVHLKPEDGPDGERGVIIMVSSAAAVSISRPYMIYNGSHEIVGSSKANQAKQPIQLPKGHYDP